MGPLPPIANPSSYQGLFAYDFGSHVSVGYTAGEIVVLRQSATHQQGVAYQIHRVDELGRIELKGIQDSALILQECFCFLRHDGPMARRDFDRLMAEAAARPPLVTVAAKLLRSYAFSPPNVTALTFPAWATDRVAGWLGGLAWSPGDQVASGLDALRSLQSTGGLTIASATLAAASGLDDRLPEQVLASTHRALQR